MFKHKLLIADLYGAIGCLGIAFDHWGGGVVFFLAFCIAMFESTASGAEASSDANKLLGARR